MASSTFMPSHTSTLSTFREQELRPSNVDFQSSWVTWTIGYGVLCSPWRIQQSRQGCKHMFGQKRKKEIVDGPPPPKNTRVLELHTSPIIMWWSTFSLKMVGRRISAALKSIPRRESRKIDTLFILKEIKHPVAYTHTQNLIIISKCTLSTDLCEYTHNKLFVSTW